jgi:hypothetical protein
MDASQTSGVIPPTEDVGHFKSASDVRDWITNEANARRTGATGYKIGLCLSE